MNKIKAPISSHRKLVDKIDKDKDGKITAKELGDWIKLTRDQHNEETVNQRWNELIERVQGLKLRDDPDSKETVDPNGPITWEEYKRASYGEKPGIESKIIILSWHYTVQFYMPIAVLYKITICAPDVVILITE